MKAVTSSIRAEPTTAPSTPASSGSVESPLVNRPVLKWAATCPEAFIRSSQSICSSLMRRWSAGVSREISCLKNRSASSDTGAAIGTVWPIRSGLRWMRAAAANLSSDENRLRMAAAFVPAASSATPMRASCCSATSSSKLVPCG